MEEAAELVELLQRLIASLPRLPTRLAEAQAEEPYRVRPAEAEAAKKQRLQRLAAPAMKAEAAEEEAGAWSKPPQETT